MQENKTAYLKTIVQMENQLSDASTTLSSSSSPQDTYFIIPKRNPSTKSVQVAFNNLTTKEGFIIYVNPYAQSIRLFDKDAKEISKFITSIDGTEKRTLLSCNNNSCSISEKSKLDENEEYYYATNIQEHFTENNKSITNYYELLLDEEKTKLDVFGTSRDLKAEKQPPDYLDDLSDNLLDSYDIITNNNILKNINSLLKNYFKFLSNISKNDKSQRPQDDNLEK